MAGPVPELREAIVLLAAVGLVVPIMQRLRVSPVLGYLAIGVAIGPYGLGRWAADVPILAAVTITDPKAVQIAGEFGVIFLLFMIGLELSLGRLWRLRRLVFGLGGAQVVVSASLITAMAAAFGNPWPSAVVLGACLALSSTAVVMQLLTEQGRLGTPVGHTAFGVLLFQDLAVVPILFLTGALGSGSEALALGLALATLKAIVSIAVLVAAGRFLVGPLLRLAGGTDSREVFLAAVLLTVIGTAAITGAAGLSLALGAFLAGLVLAETEFRHRVAVDLEPFKGLLLGIFFISVGLGIDLAVVASDPVRVLVSVVGLVALKASVIYVLARLAGQTRGTAFEVGLLLGPGGEFAFIVIGLAAVLGVIPSTVAPFMLVVVGLSMLLTPGIAALARRGAMGLDRDDIPVRLTDAVPASLLNHVVIVGYGRVGRTVGELLDRQRVPHVALDLNVDRVVRMRAAGAAVWYGDAAQPEILERLGLDRAAALAVTMDDASAVESVVRAVRRQWPALPIHVRVRDEAHAREVLDAGATGATPEITEASLQLGEAVLVATGVPDTAARDLVDEHRLAIGAR